MKDFSNVLALDIGGTNIKSTHFEAGGKVLTEETIHSVATEAKSGFDRIRANIFRSIGNLLNTRTEIIATATAGDVNPYSGKVVYATDNLPGFAGYDLKRDIEREFGLETYIINDAHAALIGECEEGAGRGCRNAAMVTIGTGIGGAYMKDGIIAAGKNFSDGRFGHIVLHEDGKLCNCGKRGCAEQYLSVTALIKESGAASLTELFGSDKYKSAAERYKDNFCRFIELVIAAVNPEKIIAGGGMIYFSQYWFNDIKSKFTVIEKAESGNTAGLLGAAYFAADIAQNNGDSKYFKRLDRE